MSDVSPGEFADLQLRADWLEHIVDNLMEERQELRGILCRQAPHQEGTVTSEFDPQLPLLDAATQLKTENDQLRAALAPFAALARKIPEDLPMLRDNQYLEWSYGVVGPLPTIAEWRAAAEAIEPRKDGP